MFEQDVAGLIKSLRNNKNEELKVINKTLLEIRKEINSKDFEIKSNAILKLVYLEMLGYSIKFSSFSIIECMSSLKFNIKFIGYLAASQSFNTETEVAVLIVNLVKKDLLSPPPSLFSSSPTSHLLSTLSSVSLLLTASLARDLAPTILTLLNHSKPLIRKQTVLVLFRIERVYSGVKELSFSAHASNSLDSSSDDYDTVSNGNGGIKNKPWIERLRVLLSDSDIGVVSATVNLICELVRKGDSEAAEYLSLAPELFGLLTGGSNNWMLIKIVKLFAVLTPLEPRLIKKLLPPLRELIETTSAMSLLYECIQTSIVGGILGGSDRNGEGDLLAKVCVEKLKGFLIDSDQNLRYISLLSLHSLLPTHPFLVSQQFNTILNLTSDEDLSIRSRALDLVEGMVGREELESTVERFVKQLRGVEEGDVAKSSASSILQAVTSSSTGSTLTTIVKFDRDYKLNLIKLIIRICSINTYQNIISFEWYLDTLIELSYIISSLSSTISSISTTANSKKSKLTTKTEESIGNLIKFQLINVCTRVKSLRPYAVEKMNELLLDDSFLTSGISGEEVVAVGNGLNEEEILGAASWICGEYCRELISPTSTLSTLFSPPPSSLINQYPKILAQYLHNALKIFNYWLNSLIPIWNEAEHRGLVEGVLEGLISVLEEESSSSGGVGELEEKKREGRELLILIGKGLDGERIKSSGQLEQLEHTSNVQVDGDQEDQGGFNEGPLKAPKSLLILSKLYTQFELNPVNPLAQSMVQIPEELDLDIPINPAFALFGVSARTGGVAVMKEERDDYGRLVGGRGLEVEDEKERVKRTSGGRIGGNVNRNGKGKRKEVIEDNPDVLARLKAERLERQIDDPYYITSSTYTATNSSNQTSNLEDDELDSIPIIKLSISDFDSPTLDSSNTSGLDSIIKKGARRIVEPVFVDIEGEMPEPSTSRNSNRKSDTTPSPSTSPSLSHSVSEIIQEKEVGTEGNTVVKVVKKKKIKKKVVGLE